ncbi:MAG TPA: hypothetical protein ACFCUC_06590 [Desulfobacterales bacterium]
MPSNNDFVDPLVEEILGDAADKFFNQRRALEHQLELFGSYEEALQVKKRMVESRAATLNELLLDSSTAADFYHHLGVEDTDLLVAAGASESDLGSLKIPFALTAGGRYRKLVGAQYERLQQICREYLFGPRTAQSAQWAGTDEDEVPAYYRLLKTMENLLNREIARTNCNMTPSCTLQFAKNLASDLGEKQQITGSASSEYSTLDEKMRYEKLSLKADGIEKFPELPPRDQVSGKIRSFCRDLSRKRPEAVRRILAKISKAATEAGN